MNHTLLMGLRNSLRQQKTICNISTDNTRNIVSLSRSENRTLIRILFSHLFIFITNHSHDIMISCIRLTNHATLKSIYNISLSQLILTSINKRLFNKILNLFNSNSSMVHSIKISNNIIHEIRNQFIIHLVFICNFSIRFSNCIRNLR